MLLSKLINGFSIHHMSSSRNEIGMNQCITNVNLSSKKIFLVQNQEILIESIFSKNQSLSFSKNSSQCLVLTLIKLFIHLSKFYVFHSFREYFSTTQVTDERNLTSFGNPYGDYPTIMLAVESFLISKNRLFWLRL